VTRASVAAVSATALFVMACGSGPDVTGGVATTGGAPPPAGGRIRGVVRLRGAVPAPAFEKVTKDHEVCGRETPVTRLALGADNGVRHAFVYLEKAPATMPLGAQEAVPVEQRRCQYSPHAMTIPAGTRLNILNDDPILHNVHARQLSSAGRTTIFNIAQPLRGQRTLVEPGLGTPGIVELTCEAGHPWMSSYVLVADHGYTSVTDEDGRFEIRNVPAGTYRLRLWHEGVRLTNVFASVQQYEYEEPYELAQEVTVPATGDVEASFDLELRGP
jgi:hypothetical protein